MWWAIGAFLVLYAIVGRRATRRDNAQRRASKDRYSPGETRRMMYANERDLKGVRQEIAHRGIPDMVCVAILPSGGLVFREVPRGQGALVASATPVMDMRGG